MLARYGWTDEDYNHALASAGFPKPIVSGMGLASLKWNATQITNGKSTINAFAKALPKQR